MESPNQNQISFDSYLHKVNDFLVSQQKLNHCFQKWIKEIDERENRAAKNVFKNTIIILVFIFIDFACLSFFIFDLQKKHENQNQEINALKTELVTLKNQIKNGTKPQ